MDCKERDWRQEGDLRGPLFIHDRGECPGLGLWQQGEKGPVMNTGSGINICFMWTVRRKAGSGVIPWFLAGVTEEMVH